ncbi:hypothetical protein M422DRAFT_23007 [Sphaerobolus stellatus SS14]|nr:hypothetical protein M422DRAFT_23007 [Sphaerobolus stellatus SS14]
MSPKLRPVSRGTSYYAVLLVLVAPVYTVVPFSWAFSLYGAWSGAIWSYNIPQLALYVWTCVEVVFSVYHTLLARRVTAAPSPPPPDLPILQAALTRVLQAGMAGLHDHKAPTLEPIEGISQDEEQDAKERGSVPRMMSPLEPVIQLEFDDPRAKDFRDYMRTWFYKKPWAEIHKHEIRQWLYWSTYSSHFLPDAKADPVRAQIIEESLTLIEKRAGSTIPEGSNPQCPAILLTLDPVTVYARPLAFYLLIWLGNYRIRSSFRSSYGLNFGKCGELEYLIRLPKGSSGKRPLVFLHGLGLGLLQYHELIRLLVKEFPTHPLLILIQPHISQDFFHPRFLNPISRHETVDSLLRVIKENGWDEDGVDVLSHSNGTFVHSWVLKAFPELVRRSCFVDPVTFCSWEGDVCYNFVYQSCVTGVELTMRYFVGTEIGVANIIQRHFDWSANSLFFEEIPGGHDYRKVAFFLAGRDAIVDAKRVHRYLQSHGVRKGLHFYPNARHGESLIAGGEGMSKVINWLREDF